MSTFYELQRKEVINIRDGTKLGHIVDIQINVESASIYAIVLPGKSKCFGLFGREDDIIIDWSCITVIGEDTILVDFDKNGHYKNYSSCMCK